VTEERVPELVRFKPRRSRVVCWTLAATVLAVFTAVSFGLRGATGDGPGVFEAGDQGAMIGLGVLAAAGILLFTRPTVEADRTGIRVRNVVGGYDLPWAVVRAVRFGRGAAWATLDLADDDVVAVMAVQAADKEYAVTAVRALRALHAAALAAPVPDE
jgi:hypothetical protein